MYASDYAYTRARFAALAHRGGAAWEPNLGKENTVHAFAQAIALGYRYLETDLHATADGRLVCLHDPTLDRVSDATGQVGSLTAADLAGVRIGGEPIAFFDEVAAMWPAARFNLDLKSDDAVGPLVRLIESGTLDDRILVSSFSQARLSRFRTLTRGAVPTGLAPPGIVVTALVPLVGRILTSPGVAAQVPVTEPVGPFRLPVVTRATVARVHAAGKVVHVWTIDDPAEMNRLIDLGADGIVTDRPDLLKQVLIDRDLWE